MANVGADGLYLNIGCGPDAPRSWINFDASPSLRLQKQIPGFLYRAIPGAPVFPPNVNYGDLVRGIRLHDGSCAGIYASHVLEHLSLQEFRKAIIELRRLLRKEGRLRLIVPDLHTRAEAYLAAVRTRAPESASNFMRSTYLGDQSRDKSLGGLLREALGNSRHRWMWDYPSLCSELELAGFTRISKCKFGDSADPRFRDVEREERFFWNGQPELALEVRL